MSCFCQRLAAVALLVLPSAIPGQEIRSPEVGLLEAQVQRAIERAEPSIACILVSRSDAYRQFGSSAADEASGKLGRFSTGPAAPGVPAVERRRALSLDLSNPDCVPESYGSGVVIDENGLVLTAGQVVRNATKIFVRLPNGKGSWGDVHALDPRSDLAVVRLLDSVPGLKAIRFGDGGAVRKGQFVLSLANPFAAGFRDGGPSASWGIVSNVRRRIPGSTQEADKSRQTLPQYGTLLQTDVRLNLGCSGGALLNLNGEMIGLTTATAAISGSVPGSYAVPLDANWRRIIDVLRQGEEVEYGFLGVQFPNQLDYRSNKTVRIQAVIPGSPAQRAGLQSGDIILSVDGVPVRDNDDLFLQVGMHLAGSTIRLEATRGDGGLRQTHVVKLARYLVPIPSIASRKPLALGGLRVDYSSIVSQQAAGFAPPWAPLAIPDGVVVREVISGSPADKAQLQPGKVITHVNGRQVHIPDEYYKAVAEAPNTLELTILDGGGRQERIPLAK